MLLDLVRCGGGSALGWEMAPAGLVDQIAGAIPHFDADAALRSAEVVGVATGTLGAEPRRAAVGRWLAALGLAPLGPVETVETVENTATADSLRAAGWEVD